MVDAAVGGGGGVDEEGRSGDCGGGHCFRERKRGERLKIEIGRAHV